MAKVFYAQRLHQATIDRIKEHASAMGESEAEVIKLAVKSFSPAVEREKRRMLRVSGLTGTPPVRQFGMPILKPSAKHL